VSQGESRGWMDPPQTSPRRRRRETHDISETLRRRMGRRGPVGALETELLDTGFEGGGFEAEERGGARRPRRDTPRPSTPLELERE